MSDEVKTTMGMTFKAFNVPNFAILALPPRGRSDGMAELPSFPIAELSPEALDALADQWLTHLYANCGRAVPWFRQGPSDVQG